MINSHRQFRLILEWAFPRRFGEVKVAWNGIEDKQTYLDREATWVGDPVTAAEVEAKEAAYDAHIASIENATANAKVIAKIVAKERLTDRRVRELVLRWAKGALPADDADRVALEARDAEFAALRAKLAP